MTEDIIYIKPQRKTIPTILARWEGQLYDAPFNRWTAITGTTVACMCARRKAVRQGRRDYTNEQILGIDDINYTPKENLPPVKEKSLQEIHNEKREHCLITKFLRGDMHA